MPDEPAPVEDLEFGEPDCPLCQIETGFDGTSRWCEFCGATWDLEGRHGEVAADG